MQQSLHLKYILSAVDNYAGSDGALRGVTLMFNDFVLSPANLSNDDLVPYDSIIKRQRRKGVFTSPFCEPLVIYISLITWPIFVQKSYLATTCVQIMFSFCFISFHFYYIFRGYICSVHNSFFTTHQLHMYSTCFFSL